MIRVRSKNVLLVAPDSFSVELLPNNKQFRQISATSRIFPYIHEIKPDVLVFDYDHVSADIEKILRRLKSNPAYSRIKICCYKIKEQPKADSLLKVLGVDQIFYEDDFKTVEKSKGILSAASAIFEATIIPMLAKTS